MLQGRNVVVQKLRPLIIVRRHQRGVQLRPAHIPLYNAQLFEPVQPINISIHLWIATLLTEFFFIGDQNLFDRKVWYFSAVKTLRVEFMFDGSLHIVPFLLHELQIH